MRIPEPGRLTQRGQRVQTPDSRNENHPKRSKGPFHPKSKRDRERSEGSAKAIHPKGSKGQNARPPKRKPSKGVKGTFSSKGVKGYKKDFKFENHPKGKKGPKGPFCKNCKKVPLGDECPLCPFGPFDRSSTRLCRGISFSCGQNFPREKSSRVAQVKLRRRRFPAQTLTVRIDHDSRGL